MVKKLYVFDWCLIGILLAGLVLLIGVVWQKKASVPQQVRLNCVLSAQYSDYQMPAFTVGDEVRNETGTVLFGTVTSVRIEPAKGEYVQNGEAVYGVLQGRSEVKLNVCMDAEKPWEYRAGGIRICASMNGCFRIGNRLVSGARIISVSEAEK